MNVFVLCTGRCGSMTFERACAHIANYTAAHESRAAELGESRLEYPDRHIEIDNRLSWLLGRLERKYGDDAFYVHLRRNDRDTARSCVKRYSAGIIKAYRQEILIGLLEETDPMTVSLDYCDTVNSNIESFLKDKTNKLTVELETIEQGFAAFWQAIGAEGDLDAALEEFGVQYNSTKTLRARQQKRTAEDTPRGFLVRAARKLERLIVKLPSYIRNA